MASLAGSQQCCSTVPFHLLPCVPLPLPGRTQPAACPTHPPTCPPEYMAYMLKYDSVHGRFPHDIHGDASGLWIDGKEVKVHAKL